VALADKVDDIALITGDNRGDIETIERYHPVYSSYFPSFFYIATLY
jgi:hypothetical protein